MKFQKPKGTSDFYPEDMALKNKIFDLIRNTAVKYNFKEIESPAFENIKLLTEKEGDEIKQQIFALGKRGNEELGLRFDLTVPAARMFIKKQKQLAKPVKWFCLNRMWRYERPQTGRLREFYQFNCEIFGSKNPEADAEVISLAIDSLKAVGLKEEDFFVKINNRKLLEGLLMDFVDKKNIEKIIRIIDKKSRLTEKEFKDELKKIKLKRKDLDKIKVILRLEESNLQDKGYSKNLNKKAQEGLNELTLVYNLLKNKYKNIKIDLSTARGLAYYTGTVFEIFDEEQKYRSLAGGGRYDKMIEMFKGEPAPATGFALGYATLLLLLKEKNLLPEVKPNPDYYVAAVNDSVKEKAVEIAYKLRKRYSVEFDLMNRNLSNQLKYANSINAKKVIIIGPDELKQGKVKVKDMSSGKEEMVITKNL